jgi:hypothetical protein
MNEQQLAAVKQALEALEIVVVDVKTTPTAYEAHRQAITALQSIISQDALHKKAENARELGLDYEPAPVQGLPFGVGGGLVAIKTLLGRDPCVHANTAIEMIDAILKEHPVAQPAVQEKCFLCGERVDSCASDVCPKSAQPASEEDMKVYRAIADNYRKDLAAAQPAPVQEPEHCDPSATVYKLAEMVMSDCGHSSNNQRLLDRITERIQRHIDAPTPPAAQPAPVQEPRARLMTYIGKGPYPKPGYTVARTYEECPENQYPDAWEEGEKLYTTPPTAQPAVQEGRDWSLLEATQESLREHMAEIKRLKAAQPAPVQEPTVGDNSQDWAGMDGATAWHLINRHADGWADVAKMMGEWLAANTPPATVPLTDAQIIEHFENKVNTGSLLSFADGVRYAEAAHGITAAPQLVPVKTYHDGKPWPVAPKPWVGLTDEEVEAYDDWADFQVGCGRQTLFDMVRDIEAKLREKNGG